MATQAIDDLQGVRKIVSQRLDNSQSESTVKSDDVGNPTPLQMYEALVNPVAPV